jgi:probable phosphoglycerate mutase
VAPPYGESFDQTATRVRQARDRLLASYGGQTVVVVSHVTPIKTLLRMALDAPPSALYRMHLDLAALNEIQWFADGPAVVHSLNDTGHLSG